MRAHRRDGWLLGLTFLIVASPVLACTPQQTTVHQTYAVEVSERPKGEPSSASTLHFDEVELPANQGLIVRVFVNLPQATAATDINSEHYVGYFALERAPTAEPRKVNLTISAPQQLPRLLGGSREKKLTVTLVPVERQGKPSSVSIRVRKVRLS